MTERDALLAAIHAAPADDAPRLVYADWLDENGQPEWAEFIRIHYEMKRVHAETGRLTPRLETLFLRQKELFQMEWARPLRECGQSAVATYNRGFGGSAFTATAAKFLEHLPALSAWLVQGSELRVSEAAGYLAVLGQRPELARVGKIVIRRGYREPPLPTLDGVRFLRSPWLGNVRELWLADLGFTADIAAGIGACPSLAALGWLHLNGNPLGAAGLRRLADCRNLGSLRILDVQSTGATDAGVTALLMSPHLAGLERLYASANEVSDGFRAGLAPAHRDVLELIAPPRGRQPLAGDHTEGRP